jgi:hypothetical protein
MDRRRFLQTGTLAAGALALRASSAWSAPASPAARPPVPLIDFSTNDTRLLGTYQAALGCLRANLQTLPQFQSPVLGEGSVYHGVWLECAPHEGAVYSVIRPDIARNNHLAFFALQKEDGQLPCNLKISEVGYGQIQMAVPIAATAWELAERSGDNELLEKAYGACSRWDGWLRRYRDTLRTGLCEGFCTYDTGQDNSPRWKGIPNRCPDADARKCPPAEGLPRLCPDLSATVYGARVALAAMASALGKAGEADRWTEDAGKIRRLIIERLYDPQDGAFYDLDAQNRFVRVRSTAILRVLGEHVVDPSLFETVWQRQVHDPRAFWAPYPFPSIALDDPQFVRPIPRNSWGGATQALTALRAPRWMEHYDKPAELASLMQKWIEALRRAGEFRQQMDPLTGDFTQTDPGGYSPAALVFFDFLWRLSGVRQQDDFLEWNVRPPAAQARSNFAEQLAGGTAELLYDGPHTELRVAGKQVAQVSGVVRLLTTRSGEIHAAVGIAEGESFVTLRLPGHPPRKLSIAANARVDLRAAKVAS